MYHVSSWRKLVRKTSVVRGTNLTLHSVGLGNRGGRGGISHDHESLAALVSRDDGNFLDVEAEVPVHELDGIAANQTIQFPCQVQLMSSEPVGSVEHEGVPVANEVADVQGIGAFQVQLKWETLSMARWKE